MDFDPKVWQDGPAGGTPMTAAEENRQEGGIVEGITDAEAAQAAANAAQSTANAAAAAAAAAYVKPVGGIPSSDMTAAVQASLGKADSALQPAGNAASATKLQNARTLQTNLGSTSTASFDGTANASPGVTGTLPVANGGTGATTLTGLVKGNGTGAMTAAVAGTDYAPATSGNGVLKGNNAGGTAAAVAGTDYTSPTGTENIANKTISAASNRVPGGLLSLVAEVNISNSAAETTVLQTNLPTGELAVGSTYRIRVHSTVLNLLASNSMTLKAYIGGVAATAAFNWAGALTNASVWNEFLITIRSIGASGSFIANSVGYGSNSGSSAVTATQTLDTTQATPQLKLTATFSAANASNNVKIEQATIERVM